MTCDRLQVAHPLAKHSAPDAGEGAAALILEDMGHARQGGARSHAEVLGYGGSCDHHLLSAPHADGQVRALQQVLRDARLAPVGAHQPAAGLVTECEGGQPRPASAVEPVSTLACRAR